jgi:DNA-binding MarR family transcriptional regulator
MVQRCTFHVMARSNPPRSPAPPEPPVTGAACAQAGPLQALLVAAHKLEDRLERGLAELDLSMGKLRVLQHLQDPGTALPLGELAARSACVRSNITQLVDRLEADGLVKRVDDPDDRRSVRATLTNLGRARLQTGLRRLADEEQAFSERLGPGEAARLLHALARLHDG